MEWLTPQFFDLLIVAVIAVGGTFAGLRLYRDFTRPLPPPRPYEQRPTPPTGHDRP